MPGRKKRLGSDSMVSTSVHIPYAYLERIKTVGAKPSKFIRAAVGEKLEREEGYIAAINRQKEVRERLELELKQVKNKIASFQKKHEEWKKKNEISRIRDIVMTEYLTGMLRTEQDLYDAVGSQIDTTHDLKNIVHGVWVDIKGAKGKIGDIRK